MFLISKPGLLDINQHISGPSFPKVKSQQFLSQPQQYICTQFIPIICIYCSSVIVFFSYEIPFVRNCMKNLIEFKVGFTNTFHASHFLLYLSLLNYSILQNTAFLIHFCLLFICFSVLTSKIPFPRNCMKNLIEFKVEFTNTFHGSLLCVSLLTYIEYCKTESRLQVSAFNPVLVYTT